MPGPYECGDGVLLFVNNNGPPGGHFKGRTSLAQYYYDLEGMFELSSGFEFVPLSTVVDGEHAFPARRRRFGAVCLREFADERDVARILGSYVILYNELRPHSALGRYKSEEAYCGTVPEAA